MPTVVDIAPQHECEYFACLEGWNPEMNSAEAARMAIKEVLAEKHGKG